MGTLLRVIPWLFAPRLFAPLLLAPRLFAPLLFALVSFLSSAQVGAAPAKVGLPRFRGPDGRLVRAAVLRVLRAHRHTVVGPAQLARAGGSQAAALEKLGLRAVVGGVVTGDADRRVATLTIHRPGGASDEVWTAEGPPQALVDAVERSFWKRVGPRLVARAAAARPVASVGRRTTSAEATAPPMPSPVTTLETSTPTPAVQESLPPPRAAVELAVGPRFFSRRLTYEGDQSGALRDYRTTSPAPAMVIFGSVFPFSEGALAHVGLAFALEYGMGLESKTQDGLMYRSAVRDMSADLAFRWPAPFMTTTLRVGVGQHQFPFQPVGEARTVAPIVPDVAYRYTRIGVEGRVHTSATVDLLTVIAYRHVGNQGELAAEPWLTGVTTWGLDAALGMAFRLSRRWEARFQVDLRRYAHDTRGREARASAAVDQYWGWWLGAATFLGGPR